MAVYSHHATLVGSVVDSIDLIDSQAPILVTNRGSSDIYVRFDAVDPVAGADNTFIVPAGAVRQFSLTGPLLTANRSIRLISSGTPAYSVEMA